MARVLLEKKSHKDTQIDPQRKRIYRTQYPRVDDHTKYKDSTFKGMNPTGTPRKQIDDEHGEHVCTKRESCGVQRAPGRLESLQLAQICKNHTPVPTQLEPALA